MTKIKILFLIVSAFVVVQMNGQVTIGSQLPPNEGALLDLKEEVVTTKGLLLPRVSLSDMNLLKMGENEILDTDDGGDQYAKHIGLVVYNTNIYDLATPGVPTDFSVNDKICAGVHVWNGTKWQPLIPYTDSLYCSGREEPGNPGGGED